MPQPQGLLFEDAESTTRREVLNMVHAHEDYLGREERAPNRLWLW